MLIVVAVAAVWLAIQSGEEVSPDDPSLAKAWYCPHCEQGVMLTPAEYNKTIARGIHPAYQTSDSGAADLTAAVLVVQCPNCGKVAVAASHCEKHDKIFDRRDADPQRRHCPLCESSH